MISGLAVVSACGGKTTEETVVTDSVATEEIVVDSTATEVAVDSVEAGDAAGAPAAEGAVK